MFLFRGKPKLPVADELHEWADDGFQRLLTVLGRQRMLNAKVVLPDDQSFPDRFDGSKQGATAMAQRIAGYMGVDAEKFTVELYAAGEDDWREDLLTGSVQTSDAAGLYFHTPEDGRFLIGIHAKELTDPASLAATLAHELAHVVLLGGGLIGRNEPDMEPLTDLCTVFLGVGVLTANAAFQFKQWTDERRQGWSTKRKGYLPEPLWGYALARFAHLREEVHPAWAAALQGNVRTYFSRSAKWLEEHGNNLR